MININEIVTINGDFMETFMFQVDMCNKCIHSSDVFNDEFRNKAYPRLKPDEMFCARWARVFKLDKLDRLHIFCEGKRHLDRKESAEDRDWNKIETIINQTFDKLEDIDDEDYPPPPPEIGF